MDLRSVAIDSFSKLEGLRQSHQERQCLLKQSDQEREQDGLDLLSRHTMPFLHMSFHFSVIGSSLTLLM
jgi:hypothetical protein